MRTEAEIRRGAAIHHAALIIAFVIVVSTAFWLIGGTIAGVGFALLIGGSACAAALAFAATMFATAYEGDAWLASQMSREESAATSPPNPDMPPADLGYSDDEAEDPDPYGLDDDENYRRYCRETADETQAAHDAALRDIRNANLWDRLNTRYR